MRHHLRIAFGMTLLWVGFMPSTWANQDPQTRAPLPQPSERALNFNTEKVFVADSKKTKTPIKDGLIIGGDRAINQVMIKDIRFSSQAGFERIVIDLEGTQNGEKAAIPRPPYYQVDVSSDQKRIGVSVWGNPELRFDAHKIHTAFKKSSILKSIGLLPKLEDDVWTFALALKSNANVEVFELSQPVRIIIDISLKKG